MVATENISMNKREKKFTKYFHFFSQENIQIFGFIIIMTYC